MQTIQQSVRTGLMRPFRKFGLAAARHWPWPVRAKLTNGRRMFVDLRSAIGRGLFMKGEFDPAVFGPLRDALKPGGSFLDVGSNVGFYSMLALDVVGDTGAVHAFEIDERPLRCLRKTVQTENIRNLFLHEAAVGQSDGNTQIAMRADSGHTSMVNDGGQRQVKLVALDTWWRNTGVRSIQAIKIDIEGAELLALKGAVGLLREERPVLVCETEPEWQARFGYDQKDLLKFLEGLGYRVNSLAGALSPTVVAVG